MKLKPIPQNTVVHTPTEAEARELLAILHENGWTWNTGEALNEILEWKLHGNGTCYKIYIGDMVVTYGDKGWFETILTLAEFKRLYCEDEKPQPKFRKGDKVKIAYTGEIAEVLSRWSAIGKEYVVIRLPDGQIHDWVISNLEPYTEPETKPTGEPPLKMTAAEGLCAMAKAEMDIIDETKELNLCELLKGHEGETFYHLMYGEVEYKGIDKDGFIAFTDSKIPAIYDDGKYDQHANVVLYPSRALYEQYPLDPYTAWMKWQERQKKFGLDVKVETYFEGKYGWEDCDDNVSCLHFRTPADRDKCIEEIKAIINKHSNKNKV